MTFNNAFLRVQQRTELQRNMMFLNAMQKYAKRPRTAFPRMKHEFIRGPPTLDLPDEPSVNSCHS